MKVWLASFLILFALAEFFQWLKQFSLPLPVFILGGAFLAIASNYGILIDPPRESSAQPPQTPVSESLPRDNAPPAISFKIERK